MVRVSFFRSTAKYKGATSRSIPFDVKVEEED